jgi:hypothetical protein
MLDLRDWNPSPEESRTLFVQSSKFMPRFAMKKLAGFVRNGGHLILSNYLPLLDENLAPCRDLATALEAAPAAEIPAKPGPLEPNTIAIAGKEIFVLDRVQTFRKVRGSRAIATSAGRICGFERRAGRGRATVLGFRLEYLFTDLGRAVLGSLLRRKLSDPCPVLTRSGGGTTLKTVLNLDDEPHTAFVDGRKIRLPGKTAAWVLTGRGRRTVFI